MMTCVGKSLFDLLNAFVRLFWRGRWKHICDEPRSLYGLGMELLWMYNGLVGGHEHTLTLTFGLLDVGVGANPFVIGAGVRALFWTILLGVLTQTGSVSAAEPSLDWPYYRSAMQLEAVRAQLGQPASIPWARALNERMGFVLKAPNPNKSKSSNKRSSWVSLVFGRG